MSEFLSNLKDALEEGKFNSDAAKKINEIDKLADGIKNPSEEIDKRIDGNKKMKEGMVSQEEYKKKMRELKIEEEKLAIIATVSNMLINIEKDIEKISEFIDDVEKAYNPEDKENEDLYKNINQLKENFKYKID